MAFNVVREFTGESIPKIKLIGLYCMTFSLSMALYMIPVIPKEFVLTWQLGVTTIVLAFVLMVVHELLHAACFKVFTGKAKIGVKFDWHYGGLYGYATSPGALLTKRQMCITLLMPQLIAVLSFIAMLVALDDSVRFVARAMIMFSLGGGCIDFYMVYLLMQEKNVTHIQDTPLGATLLQEV